MNWICERIDKEMKLWSYGKAYIFTKNVHYGQW